MIAHLYTLLDFIFPPGEDERALRKVSEEQFLNHYRAGQSDDIHTLLSFAETPVKAAVHLAKFHAHRRATRLLALVLANHLARIDQHYVMLPIPLSNARRRQRGYNQVENILAESARIVSGHTLETRILVRKRDTLPQTTLSREARRNNVANAFGIRDIQRAEKLVHGQHILIVDDVTTTGATLKAAKAALLPLSPTSITLLALAH